MGGVLHVTAFLVETQNTILNLKMRIICLLYGLTLISPPFHKEDFHIRS